MRGWQTFETKPKLEQWIHVYAVDNDGLYWIDTYQWMGSYLREITTGGHRPLLWRPRPPEPSEDLVRRARGLIDIRPEVRDDAPVCGWP